MTKIEKGGVKKRIEGVDLNFERLNSTYYAALHNRISEEEISLKVIRQQINNDLFLPSSSEVSQILFLIQSTLRSSAEGRKIINLSPIGIRGFEQVITKSSPRKIAHLASKAADVVSDPTIQLAAEAVRVRQSHNLGPISLGAFHRCLRLQKYSSPDRTSIFEMYGTLDSYSKISQKESDHHMINLIQQYLRVIRILDPNIKPEVCISHIGIADKILENIKPNVSFQEKAKVISDYFDKEASGRIDYRYILTKEFIRYCEHLDIEKWGIRIQKILEEMPKIDGVTYSAKLDRSLGIGHYSGLTFMIYSGSVDLVDGGEVDWVSRLTSNRKEQSFVSGFGTDMLAGLINNNH